jgi:hypothetical protein
VRVIVAQAASVEKKITLSSPFAPIARWLITPLCARLAVRLQSVRRRGDVLKPSYPLKLAWIDFRQPDHFSNTHEWATPATAFPWRRQPFGLYDCFASVTVNIQVNQWPNPVRHPVRFSCIHTDQLHATAVRRNVPLYWLDLSFHRASAKQAASGNFQSLPPLKDGFFRLYHFESFSMPFQPRLEVIADIGICLRALLSGV